MKLTKIIYQGFQISIVLTKLEIKLIQTIAKSFLPEIQRAYYKLINEKLLHYTDNWGIKHYIPKSKIPKHL